MDGNGAPHEPVAGLENASVGTVVSTDIARAVPEQAFSPVRPVSERQRQRMRSAAIAAGYAHALDSLSDVVAVEVSGSVPTPTMDQRMREAADATERAVLDAMVVVARAHGWRGGQ